MKGKIALYYTAENIAKVRSRVENPGKDFTGKIRTAIQASIAEVINKNILDVRAAMIKRFQELGMTVKDAKQAAALANPLQAYFDVVVSETPFKGGDDEETDDTAAPAEAAPAEEKKNDDFEE